MRMKYKVALELVPESLAMNSVEVVVTTLAFASTFVAADSI
jgi:hypothetical protein